MRPLLLCFFVMISVTSPARADVFNRQYLPLGERQAFMANAGVGRSGDGGAGYYNPSGLTELERNQIAVTANTYFIYNLDLDAIAVAGAEKIPYEASGFNMIPTAANMAWGKGDWKVGLSVMLPESFQIQNRAPISTSTVDGQVLQSQLSQDLWGGLSFARKLDDRWSLGVTFWAMQHASTEVVSMRAVSLTTADTVSNFGSRTELNVVVGSVTLGAGFQATPSTKLGLRVQTPTFRLLGFADVYQSSDVVNSGTLTSTEVDEDDLKGYYRLPLDMTVGVSQIVGSFEFLLDVSLQFPVSYQAVPKFGDETEVKTTFAPRASFGMDITLSPTWSLRSGVFYTPSALEKLEVGSGETDFDMWGTTLGLLWRAGQIETSGGLFFMRGNGKSAPTDTTEMFDATISTYGALLASSYLF